MTALDHPQRAYTSTDCDWRDDSGERPCAAARAIEGLKYADAMRVLHALAAAERERARKGER